MAKKRKKRRKLTKEAKRLLMIIILAPFIYLFIKSYLSTNKIDNKENNQNKINNSSKTLSNYENYITNINYEYTNNIKIISSGMNVEDFKGIFNKSENYVNKVGSYKQINYNFEKKLTYSEIENIFNDLNKSDIVKLENIGKSFDGRNIYIIEIGKGSKVTMFEGNIHAAEIAPLLYLTKYAVNLVNSYEKGNKDVMNLLENNKIVIVPTINPDGYNYTIGGKSTINNKNSYVYQNDSDIEQDYYKANINGVDLNRNFPSRNGGLYFKKYTPSTTLSTKKSTERLAYFPGDELASEPETKALIYFMYKYQKDAHIYAAVHSAGRVIYHGKPDLSSEYNRICSKTGRIVSNITGYQSLGVDYEDVGYGSDGSATDMISEIKHGFKFSTKIGRLVPTTNDIKLDGSFCAMTIETLDSYTTDLKTIKEEYENNNLEKAFNALVTFES